MSIVPSTAIAAGQAELRQALIDEEVCELRAAVRQHDIVEIADALADIVYVAYGTAWVYGIDLDAVLAEVHASNMTKLGADGRPIRRADGKVLKGPDFRQPDIAAVLDAQRMATGTALHGVAGSARATALPSDQTVADSTSGLVSMPSDQSEGR